MVASLVAWGQEGVFPSSVVADNLMRNSLWGKSQRNESSQDIKEEGKSRIMAMTFTEPRHKANERPLAFT